LIALLGAKRIPHRAARRALADLLLRFKFDRRGRGRPRTPSYDRTIVDAHLEAARQYVNELMAEKGISERDAIEEAARRYRIPSAETSERDILGNFIEGTRGSSGRMKRRRPGAE
jgi:hypothetical protein